MEVIYIITSIFYERITKIDKCRIMISTKKPPEKW